MLSRIMRSRMDAFEREWDYDMSYARQLLDASPAIATAFAAATKLGEQRVDLPLDAWHAAKLATILHDDCGACAQLTVQMAERDGIDPALLRAIIRQDFDALPEGVRIVVRFCLASLERTAQADELREQLVAYYSPRALASVAVVMAASRLYPTVKYALGHGAACALLDVGGKRVVAGALNAA